MHLAGKLQRFVAQASLPAGSGSILAPCRPNGRAAGSCPNPQAGSLRYSHEAHASSAVPDCVAQASLLPAGTAALPPSPTTRASPLQWLRDGNKL